jgi:TP901 family phage tail tape measure protein
MANEKHSIVIDLDIVPGAITSEKITKKTQDAYIKSLDSIHKAIEKHVLRPDVPLEVKFKVDGKAEKAALVTIDQLFARLASHTAQKLQDHPASGPITQYFSNLEKAFKAVSLRKSPELAKLIGDASPLALLEKWTQDPKAFDKMPEAMRRQALVLTSQMKNYVSLMKQVVRDANNLRSLKFDRSGEKLNVVDLLPFNPADLSAALTTLEPKLKAFSDLTAPGKIEQRLAGYAKEREARRLSRLQRAANLRQLRKFRADKGSGSQFYDRSRAATLGVDFDFEGTKDAAAAESKRLRDLLRTRPDDPMRGQWQARRQELVYLRQALLSRRSRLFGASLATSVEGLEQQRRNHLDAYDWLRTSNGKTRDLSELTPAEIKTLEGHLRKALTASKGLFDKEGTKNRQAEIVARQSALADFLKERDLVSKTEGVPYATRLGLLADRTKELEGRRLGGEDDLRKLKREATDLHAALMKLRREFSDLVPDEAVQELDAMRDRIATLRATAKDRTPEAISKADAKRLREAGQAAEEASGRESYYRVGGRRGFQYLAREELPSTLAYVEAEIKRLKSEQQTLPSSDRDTRRSNDRRLADLARERSELKSDILGNVSMLRQLGLAINGFVRYAAVYGGLYQLMNAFTGLARSAVAFQDALKQIQTIAQATDGQMVRLASSIREMASTSPYNLEQLAQSAQTLAQAGVEISKIPGALKAVTNLSLATGGTPEVAADVLTSAQKVFPQLNDARIADQLTGAVNVSKLSLEDLKTILNLGAQTASASNVKPEQMLGMAATLSNFGIKGSTIATGLRQLMLEMFSPDRKLTEVYLKRYQQMGEVDMTADTVRRRFASFKDTDDPMAAALAELRRMGFAGAQAGMLDRQFETRAQNVLIPLLRSQDMVAGNVAAIGQSGTAAEGARMRIDSLSSALKILSNEMQSTADVLGEPLLKSLQGITEWASGTIKSLRETLDARRARGESVAPDALPAIMGGIGAGLWAPFGALGKVAAGAVGGLAAGAASISAEGLGRSISAITNILITLWGVGQLLKTSALKDAGDLFKGKSSAGWAVLKNLPAMVTQYGRGLLSLAAEAPKLFSLAGLARVTGAIRALAAANPLGWLITIATVGYELYDAFKSAAPGERLDALRRQLAQLEEKANSNEEAFKAYDPNNTSGIVAQLGRNRQAVEAYQEVLWRLFGNQAQAVEQALQQMSPGMLLDDVEKATAEIKKVLGRDLSAMELRALQKAYSDMEQARQGIAGQSKALLERVNRLLQTAEDKLTDEEKALRDAVVQALNSPAFGQVGRSSTELVNQANSLMEVLRGVFDRQSQELARQREQLSRQVTGGQTAQEAEQGQAGVDRLRARANLLLLNPTPENLRELDELNRTLQDTITRRREDESSLFPNGFESAEARRENQRTTRMLQDLQQRIVNSRTEYAQRVAEAEQRSAEAQERNAAQEQERNRRLGELQNREMELRERRFEAERDRLAAEQAARDLEARILQAQERNDIPSITRRGGLLDQRAAQQRTGLTLEEQAARLQFERAAIEAGVEPGDLRSVMSSENENLQRAYQSWRNADKALRDLANETEQERQRMERTMRPDAYEPSPQAQQALAEARRLEEELYDERRETMEELEAKFNEVKRLRLLAANEEIEHLRSRQGQYAPNRQDDFRRDVARLEARREDALKEIEKRHSEKRRQLLDERDRLELRQLEQERQRLRQQLQDQSSGLGDTRSAVLSVEGRALAGGVRRLRLNAEQQQIAAMVAAEAERQGIDPALAQGLAMTESSFNPAATSSAGAYGIMQLMPGTARRFRVDRNVLEQNIQGGVAYLRYLRDYYNGREDLAVAAYNAGEHNVTDHIPQNGETPTHVARTMAYREMFRRGGSGGVDTAGVGRALADIDRRISDVNQRIASRSGNPEEVLAADAARSAQDRQENLTLVARSATDSIRNGLRNRQVELQALEAAGIPYGAEQAAAREAAGMGAAPSAEVARLQALETVLLDLVAQIQDALDGEGGLNELLATAEKEKAGVEQALKQPNLPEADRLRLEGQKTGYQTQIREYEALKLELDRNLADTKQALGANRQQQQFNKPTWFSDKGSYGQLDQALDVDALASELNKLSYSFSNLGKNIRSFAVNVIDRFVSTLAESIVNGFEQVDEQALIDAHAELRDAQAEAAYQRTVKTEEIRQLDARLGTSEADQARRAELANALNESMSAQNARINAAQEQLRQQEQANPMATAMEGLAKEGAITLLKTSLLAPFQLLLDNFGFGQRGSSPVNPLYVSVVKGAGDLLGSAKDLASDAWEGVKDGAEFLGDSAAAVGGFFTSFFARGGYVRGPGSGTSDSIPAMLSNGEYVLTADEVKAIGVGRIEAWKSAIKSPARFATGGLVQAFDRAAPAMANSAGYSAGGDGTTVNIIDQRSSQSSEPVQVNRRAGPNQKDVIEVLVRDAVNKAITSGQLDKTMGVVYGARRMGGLR